MLRPIVLFAFLLFPCVLFAQTSTTTPFASSRLLQSGVVLGSDRERYFSVRMQALGGDFSGIIEDEVTDLYRNPAYFARVENPFTFGEIVRPQYSYEYIKQIRITSEVYQFDPLYYGYSSSDNAGASTGLRYAYASKFGVLVRGNYRANTNQQNNSSSGFSQYDDAFRTSENIATNEFKSTWGDIQASYGFDLDNGLTGGVSYTFGINEAPSKYSSVNRSSSLRRGTPTSAFDSSVGVNEVANDVIDRVRSHTARVGLHWEKEESDLDAVGTLEFLNGTSERTQVERSNSYSAYSYVDTARRWVNLQNTTRDVSSIGDAKGTNVRLDVRYHRSLEEGRTFTAQLGGGVAFFSSDDKQNYLNASFSSIAQYDTTTLLYLSRTTRTGLPDGFGYQVNASAGWTFPVDKFLIAVSGVVNAGQIKYDYDARQTSFDTLYQRSSFGNPTVRRYNEQKTFAHNHTVFVLRVALPIAMEVEALKDFDLRAGWVPKFVRNVNKDESNDNGFRNSTDNLDVTTTTFGLGYQIFDKLRVDMVNYGDIAQPRSWNIAAMYTF